VSRYAQAHREPQCSAPRGPCLAWGGPARRRMMPFAIVTGSSSGIGMAIARRLLADGWHVQGFDRAPATLADAHFSSLAVDLTDGKQIDSALDTVLGSAMASLHGDAEGRPPDALVHAAGLLRVGPLGALDPSDGETMWRLHVDAATRLANRLLPAMQAAGRGRMVLVGSRVSVGIAGRSQYAASKAALVSLARSWAAESIAKGVTVNVVSPSATDTPMLVDPARTGTAPRLPPIGRLIKPEEVAALVAFLLSGDAAAITGQDIAVCGGASVRG
jgi:3-oxoacyl-[acyl-carrier protein] reductase